MISSLSKGSCAIALLAVLSTAAVVIRGGSHQQHPLNMWTSARPHADMYHPMIAEWNASPPPGRPTVGLELISAAALEHRMLSAFFAGIQTADLLEVERGIAGRAFTGPVDAIGFLDLTERLDSEGLLDAINPPSLEPWTSRGRVFGLPHDVHPVMLGYRADLLDGVDIASVETWDDFARVMRPLVADTDSDGTADRYPLAFWPSELDKVELLLIQGGGTLFDAAERPIIATEANARLLARMVSWCVGPDRIAAEVPDFSASGNTLKVRGRAICYFFPDWMCDVWNKELPQLAGTMRLMPLPAWEPGGRRTSVWGGTMLAIPKTARDIDSSWAFAKHLYVSRELARELYRVGDIITPIKSYWDDPVFDEPDPYFGGQIKGRMYIGLAPTIPLRSSSPYSRRAMERVADAGMALLDHANSRGIYDAPGLEGEALQLLGVAQESIERQMARTAVFREASEASP